MNTRSAGTVTAIIALALAVSGCGSADIADQAAAGPATSSTAAAANSASPVGVIAIGHSGLTGEGSDPNRPGQVALENSWATGTSPQVNSIYRRLVAVRPETEGHVANTAEGGAPAATLLAQAQYRPGNCSHSGTRFGPDDRQRHRLRRDRSTPRARVRGRPRRRLGAGDDGLARLTDPGGRTARTTQSIVCQEAGRRGPDNEGGAHRNRHV